LRRNLCVARISVAEDSAAVEGRREVIKKHSWLAPVPLPRLLTSVKAEAKKVAAAQGTTLNQFIHVAVTEQLGALRTAQFFQGRAARADLAAFDRLLRRAGTEPPGPGDDIDTRRALRTGKPSTRSRTRSVRPSAKRTA